MFVAPQIFVKKISIATAMLCVAVLFSASQELSVKLSGASRQSIIPLGFIDTMQSGREKADQDIAKGTLRYGIGGRASRHVGSYLRDVGVIPIFFGCVLTEKGMTFWNGYNQQIRVQTGIEIPAIQQVLTRFENS